MASLPVERLDSLAHLGRRSVESDQVSDMLDVLFLRHGFASRFSAVQPSTCFSAPFSAPQGHAAGKP
jgi:hypothetical protein